MDESTREIVGLYVGDRSRTLCLGLMGVFTRCVPSMRRVPHRLLGSLSPT